MVILTYPEERTLLLRYMFIQKMNGQEIWQIFHVNTTTLREVGLPFCRGFGQVGRVAAPLEGARTPTHAPLSIFAPRKQKRAIDAECHSLNVSYSDLVDE